MNSFEENNKINSIPVLMTVPEVAATGLMSEYFLRSLIKQGVVPCVQSGRKYLINYEMFCAMLNDPNWAGYRRVS